MPALAVDRRQEATYVAADLDAATGTPGGVRAGDAREATRLDAVRVPLRREDPLQDLVARHLAFVDLADVALTGIAVERSARVAAGKPQCGAL